MFILQIGARFNASAAIFSSRYGISAASAEIFRGSRGERGRTVSAYADALTDDIFSDDIAHADFPADDIFSDNIAHTDALGEQHSPDDIAYVDFPDDIHG